MNKTILSLTCLCVTAMLTSCNDMDSKSILGDLTPNMNGLGESTNENDAGIAVTNNQNDRMYIDDWRRLMLLDKPSILSPFPIVSN